MACTNEGLKDDESSVDASHESTGFVVSNSNILKNNVPIHYKGANALQTYGLANAELMNEWQLEITREFIGNLGEQPISGGAIFASDAVWYHSLQNIVNQNRANGRVTILCPFGWVNTNGDRTLLTGLNPSEQLFYNDYKIKMRAIATHFKDQPDVWLEVWNEPFHWNNDNNYSHDLWLQDMSDMVDNLRAVEGFQNIIIVPGNEQGQSETAILSKGNALLEGRTNIVFDMHAYEKWLLNSTTSSIVDRIETIKNENFALIFGEVGVQNVTEVMPVNHFLEAVNITETSTMAWLWNLNSTDNNALLNDDGQPNANSTNNFWGNTYYEYLIN